MPDSTTPETPDTDVAPSFVEIICEALREIGYRDVVAGLSTMGDTVEGIERWHIVVSEDPTDLPTIARVYCAVAEQYQGQEFVALIWTPRSNDRINVFAAQEDLLGAVTEIVNCGMPLTEEEQVWVRALAPTSKRGAAYRVGAGHRICRTELGFGDLLTLLARWRQFVALPPKLPKLRVVPQFCEKLDKPVNRWVDYTVYRDAAVDRETDEQIRLYGYPLVASVMSTTEYTLRASTLEVFEDDPEELPLDELLGVSQAGALGDEGGEHGPHGKGDPPP